MRNSWLMVARNRDLVRLAVSANSLARRKAASALARPAMFLNDSHEGTIRAMAAKATDVQMKSHLSAFDSLSNSPGSRAGSSQNSQSRARQNTLSTMSSIE